MRYIWSGMWARFELLQSSFQNCFKGQNYQDSIKGQFCTGNLSVKVGEDTEVQQQDEQFFYFDSLNKVCSK